MGIGAQGEEAGLSDSRPIKLSCQPRMNQPGTGGGGSFCKKRNWSRFEERSAWFFLLELLPGFGLVFEGSPERNCNFRGSTRDKLSSALRSN